MVPLDASLYNGDGDMVEPYHVLRIHDIIYHFEFQYTKDGLELKINFQDGQYIVFKVPAICLQNYNLDVINSKKLWLFFPFMVLQFAADMKGKKHLSEQEVLDNYREMIDYIEAAYNSGEITLDEDATLLESMQETNQHTMKKHLKILKGVEDMLNPTLELKHKQIARNSIRNTCISNMIVPKQLANKEIRKFQCLCYI